MSKYLTPPHTLKQLFLPFFFIVIALLVACTPDTPETNDVSPPVTDTDNLSIALLTDIDDLMNDYYRLSYDAMRSFAARSGADLTIVPVHRPSFTPDAFDDLAQNGLDIAVMTGFSTPELFVEYSNKYPDIYFVSIDYYMETMHDNATSIIFDDTKVGYLAGVLAANLTESNKIGGVYGLEQIPTIIALANGYELGAKSVNPDIEVLKDFDSGPNPFSDPEGGAEMANLQLDQGVDVIFAAAGGTGIGALEAVASYPGNEQSHYCIGVDTDQWSTVTNAQPCLISSAIKNIPRAIDDVLTLIINGTPPSDQFIGTVKLAPFHDFSEQFADLEISLEQLSQELETTDLPAE